MTQDTDEKPKGWRGSRELWLDAAREAFIASGIDAVKIQPLASRLGLSRTSFYWFFDDREALLQALLDDWEEINTRCLVQATEGFAETITEAVLSVIGVFLPGGGFEPRLDLAVRGWAHQSDAIAAKVNSTDELRLSAIRAMFERFGFDPDEADVRARTMYLVQIGYISMQVQEDVGLRLARIPNYVKTFTGQAPDARDLARFEARHGGADLAG
ncbi:MULTISPECIES: TetR/AcrR family transcriptional regulator [Mameliella]|uniref:TetR/AcrR family transcriptional regulator n=1 Tax=Mameliella TaxID=1434019 RepID=UPI000B535B8A|nr:MULTISPECIES: TetR/AcrR family transcriptional regulator [Mameliella]MCR9274837.1 TetR/AcrR family transcriptional regulator [Paracoccaceae bacterium]OWV58063.1 TetR family transcriptional regulator [Mameliella alba]